jgi:hypothetical protein
MRVTSLGIHRAYFFFPRAPEHRVLPKKEAEIIHLHDIFISYISSSYIFTSYVC